MSQDKIDYKKLTVLTKAYYAKLANEFLDKLDDMLDTTNPFLCKAWYNDLFPKDPESDDEIIKNRILLRFATLMTPNDTTLSPDEKKSAVVILNQILQIANVSSPLFQIYKKVIICTKLMKAFESEDIEKCRSLINDAKNAEESGWDRLKVQRNPGWDMFLTVISSLIFPIAIGRSIHSKLAYDTFDFNISDGEKLARKFKKEYHSCLGTNDKISSDQDVTIDEHASASDFDSDSDDEYGEEEGPSVSNNVV